MIYGVEPARFWAKVDKSGECWLWTGTRSGPEGYGVVWVSATKRIRAHRVAWGLEAGTEPPADLCICHRCDNPPCVRPEHLFLGTAGDNARDRLKKGRQPCTAGEAHARAKLTVAQVLEIRRLHAEGGWTYPALGQRFGVSSLTMSDVVKRRTWRHV